MNIKRIGCSLLWLTIVLGSCTYTMKIRDGRMAYEAKQYAVAARMLEKEYQDEESRVEKGKIAYLIGKSYQKMNRNEASIDWFLNAYDYGYGIDALKEYAYGLKQAERYQEAIRAFKDLGIEIGSPYEYRREINACEVAMGWKDIKRKPYQVELLSFNSGNADYAPSLYEDRQLVITSDRSSATGEATYNWTGNAFSDLFLVDPESNQITGFDERLNTPDNEGAIAFTPDYSEAYFTRCFGPEGEDKYCKIMVSTRQGESWSKPEVLDFMEAGINYGHPAISADGNKLYFSCEHPDGWGGYDIWVCDRTDEGWSAPLLLSRSVNTIGNEKFPTVDRDTLYFSSDFHTGMGGLDIFKTYPLSNGSWAPAYNLQTPVNSGGDDFGLVVDRSAPTREDVLQTGYFTSTRNQGMGGDDIYRFQKIKLPPPPVTEAEEPKEIEYKMILNGYVLEKIYEAPTDPNSRVLGRRPLPGARVKMEFAGTEDSLTVGEDGRFTLELDENTDYNFLASKTGFLTNEAKFSTRGIGKDPNNPVQTFQLEIVLDKIFLNKEIVLENIYYDFDRANIREDAQPTLNELTNNLKLNPGIRIQLASHTDCRGSDAYNQDLSQRRAQSAVDYLIEQGIAADRLEAKGYGESRPAVECICARCTEEQHQANRRTTFAVIE